MPHLARRHVAQRPADVQQVDEAEVRPRKAGQLDYYEAADGDAPKGGEKLQLVHRGSFQLHNSTVVELAPSPGLAAGAAAKGGGGGFFRALRNMAGGDDGDPPNGFVVRSGTRVLACYADDAASMEAWIKAIRRNGDYEPRDAANPLPLNHGWVVKSAGPRAGGRGAGAWPWQPCAAPACRR